MIRSIKASMNCNNNDISARGATGSGEPLDVEIPLPGNTRVINAKDNSLEKPKSMWQVVTDSVKFNKQPSESPRVTRGKGTPALSDRKMKNSPRQKLRNWTMRSKENSQSRPSTKVSKREDADNLCLLSDAPDYIIRMAKSGKVKEIADVCNIEPERIKTVDSRGASVLHHATAQGRMRVMDFVLGDQEGSKLLNALDDGESTPLHWAVCHDNANSVDYLLSRGADPKLKNKFGETPLHLSVIRNSIDSLKTIIKYKDVMSLDEKTSFTGETALHYAANIDNEEAANILLYAGAMPCTPSAQGYTSIHSAAFNGSQKVLKLILEMGEKYGYPAEEVLSFSDKELCSPLHTAVVGGNAAAIMMCLNFGAQLDKVQADLSTPMHMVCSQGAFDIVQLMFENARDQSLRTLTMADKQNQTPLHKAAMYGHANIIKYLIGKGADIDALDDDLNTPLLLAASREKWYCVRVLIELGASMIVKNKNDRNFMHMIVLNGGDIRKLDELEEITNLNNESDLLTKPEVHQLLDKPDSSGCTPLHYACQEGNLASLETLMKLGVSARLKSLGNQSPLHFAAIYGRFNACRRLLNSPQGPNIINEKDDNGMTPLLYASQNGHTKVVQLFLSKGSVFHRNNCGKTALHVAAENGYTRTIRILVEMNRSLLDETDDEGNTALHFASIARKTNAVKLLLDLDEEILRNQVGHTFFTEAIENKNREVALCAIEHERWEEAMQVRFRRENMKIPALLMIQHLPDVWGAALDRCIVKADCHPKSKDYWIRYQFKYLQPNIEDRDKIIEKLKEEIRDKVEKENSGTSGAELTGVALPALNKMVVYNRVECLRHPVSLAYLRMKWNQYGRWVYAFNLFFYMLGLFPLTYLICTIDPAHHNDPTAVNSSYSSKVQTAVSYSRFQMGMMVLLTAVAGAQLIKEIVQMIQQTVKYFNDVTNLVEWALYISTLLYVIPFFTGFPLHWQFQMGALAIFLAWFNLLLFLQRIDIAGIYVVMFLEILRTLLRVLAIFSFLIVAFSLSFFVLMSNESDKSFSNPALSIMRVVTMSLGELGYVDKFLTPHVDGNDETLHFSNTSMALLFIFIITMPILLMNLLIGLAVGDIAEVQNNAALQRLAMQVHLHTDIENKLSTRLLRLIDKEEETVYPNCKCGFFNRMLGFVQASTLTDDYGDTALSKTDRSIGELNLELQKQKDRLKDMQTSLSKQYEMMRLIVQKMEIRSEIDDQDEGLQPNVQRKIQQNRGRGGLSSVGSKLLAIRALKPPSQ